MFQLLQGGFDPKHVFCKFEIHLSYLRCVNGQHHSFPDFCNGGCTQVGLLIDKQNPGILSRYLWLFASRYVLIFIQDRGSWSSKSSWDGKSSWNFDLLSWCNDHDIIQGAYHEKSLAPCNPYSRKYCHTWELVTGFYSEYCKLHNLVYMVHHAGLAPT